PDALAIVAQISALAAMLCLLNALQLGATAASDNGLLQDWIGITNNAPMPGVDKASQAQRHADLAKLSLEVELPAFELESFEEMLDLRWRYRAEIESLREA